MQFGFVIDHSRCIGCHACTVACKSENDVPLGDFRTWVKYTESGSFPTVRRSFAVLRCNQCSEAPCVIICPVGALDKREDGIVDVDPDRCIGCKACMQGCPYDALYLNEDSGTAEKCHFCAHRVESGLAPACAVVCPTEAIIPGDFHDPGSVVFRLRDKNKLSVRKPEAGTGPNVLYREVSSHGIDPLSTTASGGYMWANRSPHADRSAEEFDALQEDAETRARTTYDVDHPARWGGKITAYLFFKSISAGLFLSMVLAWILGYLDPTLGKLLSGGSLFSLLITTIFLIADLKRPDRFLYILIYPNWSSWLTRGSFLIAGFGGVAALCFVLFSLGVSDGGVLAAAMVAGTILAILSAGYTGWLFGQARGRVLWMRKGLWAHLIVQALLAGSAMGLVIVVLLHLTGFVTVLKWLVLGAMAAHAGFVLGEHLLSPRNREAEFRKAVRLITRGPFASRHYLVGMGVGILVPAVLLFLCGPCERWAAAGILALVGLWIEEDIMVKAGQALPIS